MDIYQPANRRFGSRINFRGAVEVLLTDSPEPRGCVGCDLSESGIRLNLTDFLPINKEVSFKIHLADEKVVDCRGRVVWVKKSPFADRYEAGLTLIEEEPNLISKFELRQFIRYQR